METMSKIPLLQSCTVTFPALVKILEWKSKETDSESIRFVCPALTTRFLQLLCPRKFSNSSLIALVVHTKLHENVALVEDYARFLA